MWLQSCNNGERAGSDVTQEAEIRSQQLKLEALMETCLVRVPKRSRLSRSDVEQCCTKTAQDWTSSSLEGTRQRVDVCQRSVLKTGPPPESWDTPGGISDPGHAAPNQDKAERGEFMMENEAEDGGGVSTQEMKTCVCVCVALHTCTCFKKGRPARRPTPD